MSNVQTSSSYKTLRSKLRDAETELMLQRERVAELRRSLPADEAVQDYELVGDSGPVRLSDLLAGGRTLVLYHFMYGKAQTSPCPMCTMWADGFDGLVHHLEQRLTFGLVAAAPVDRFRAHADTRGWSSLRLLSAGESTLKFDLGSEDADGGQTPAVSVFTAAPDGSPRHFYTGSAHLQGGHWRGLDLLNAAWHIFDLTPDGRGDWVPAVRYD